MNEPKGSRRNKILRVLAAALVFCLLFTYPSILDTLSVFATGAQDAAEVLADHSHPLCGMTNCSHSSPHGSLSWTSFTGTGGELETGNYYLTGDDGTAGFAVRNLGKG